MISAIGSAMSGIAGAIGRFDRASASLARPDAPDASDPISDRVEQIAAKHVFEANLATIRTADDMIGSLIDVVA